MVGGEENCWGWFSAQKKGWRRGRPPLDPPLELEDNLNETEKIAGVPEYPLGKRAPPPLFVDYDDTTATDILENKFKKDIV